METKHISTGTALNAASPRQEQYQEVAKASALFLDMLKKQITPMGDSTTISRFSNTLLQILRADKSHVVSERKLSDAPLHLLNGFEFNSHSATSSVLSVQPTAIIHHDAGKLSCEINGFVPLLHIQSPKDASHFSMYVAGVQINFDTGERVMCTSATACIPCNGAEEHDIDLSVAMKPKSKSSLFLLLGIDFFENRQGKPRSLNNGGANALAIIGTSCE